MSGGTAGSRPDASVIVPFFGDETDAAAMFAALSALRLGQGDELIVVDNTGNDVVARALATAPPPPPGIRVVAADRERSSYYARNVGAEAAAGEWLCFIDSDTRPAPDLMDRYLAEGVGERDGVIAGAVVSAPDQPGLVPAYARSRGHISEEWHMDRGPYPAGVTANLAVRRTTWDGLGGFHEGIRSGADVEFCWRAQRAGWGLVHRPEARVEHVQPATLRAMLRKARRHTAGRRWVNRLYAGALPRPRMLRPLARSLGGALVWTITLRFRRGLYKLMDGAMAAADFAGYHLGDNRAERPGEIAREPGDPRIAMLTDAFPARSETFVYNEVLRLRELGWAVHVESSARPLRPERSVVRALCVRYLEDDPLPEKAAALAWLVARHPVCCLRDLGGRRRWAREERPWRLASLAPAVRRVGRSGARHVHAHFAAGAALHGLRIARLLGIGYSVAPHAYDIFQKPRNLAEKLDRAAFVVTESNYAIEHLRQVADPATAERMHRLILGVDVERFHRERPSPGGRTVVAVGRLVEKKGLRYLVEAAASLRAEGAVDRVVICGEGPERELLAAQIRELELDGTVTLVAGWGPDRVRELLTEADVFALPCVIAPDGDRDSMPVAVKEALAMELPVVTTDVAGLPEIVRPEWGRLVPPRDPAALAAAIREVLALPPEERAAMGRRAREFVLAECTIEGDVELLTGLLRDAMAGEAPGS